MGVDESWRTRGREKKIKDAHGRPTAERKKKQQLWMGAENWLKRRLLDEKNLDSRRSTLRDLERMYIKNLDLSI